MSRDRLVDAVECDNDQVDGDDMKCRVKYGNVATGICLAILSGVAYADDTVTHLDLPTAASVYANDLQSLESRSFNSQTSNARPVNSSVFMIAAKDADVVQQAMSPVAPAPQFESPWLSGRKAHQYLGLGTVLFAGLTMLAAPEDGEDCETNCAAQPPRQTSGTTHTRLARTTAALAVATVATGLIYHWNDIHWEDAFTDPDKMHARLGAAGALLLLYAVNKSANSSVPTDHATAAELGAVAMLVAIKLTW